MDVKEAISRAKAYVADVFEGEGIAELQLEETEYRGGEWRITVSFSRPLPRVRDVDTSPLDALVFVQGRGRRRLQKVVMMDDDGQVLAMKDRAWMDAAG